MNEMKIDKINKLFHCQFCAELFKEPILLPCGSTVCRKDLDNFKSNKPTFIECVFCNQEHVRPTNDYPIVKQIVELMDIGNHSISLGETWNQGRSLLNDFELKLNELEHLNSKSNTYLNGFFENMIDQIDLRREQMKIEIDTHFNEILNEIKKLRADCENQITLDEDDSSLQKEIEASKNKFNKWVSTYDTLVLNEKQRDKIILETKLSKIKHEQTLDNIKDKLLSNKSFELKYEPFDVNKYLSIEFKKQENRENVIFKHSITEFKEFANNPGSCSDSMKYSAGGFKWHIKVEHESNGFISCDFCSKPAETQINQDVIMIVEYQISLININDPAENYTQSDTDNFTINRNLWSWLDFYKIEDLVKNGFYDEQNDSLTFEVIISTKIAEKST